MSRPVVGYVASGASPRRILVELTRSGEEEVEEGKLLLVESRRAGELVARVDELRSYSELHQPGGLLSAARREGLLESYEHHYVVAECSVIGRLSGSGLAEARRPPEPGAPVKLFPSSAEGLRRLYGVEPGSPGVVWYGSLLGYEELPLALDVEALTMHLGVFGETGSGKSYGFGYLLELLSRVPLGGGEEAPLPVTVIDANGDYLDYWEDFRMGGGGTGFGKVLRLAFPSSRASRLPFARPLRVNLDEFTAREVAELIVAYKTGGRELNEMQVAAIEAALKKLEGEGGYTHTKAVVEVDALLSALDELGERRRVHAQTLRAARAAVEKFYRDVVELWGIVSTEPSLSAALIEEAVRGGWMLIVDFSAEGAPGVPLTVKQLVVAYLARLLYSTFTEWKLAGREAYMMLAIEEAQNYAPNTRRYPVHWSLARDYLSLIATQGRKFGLMLAVVSQRPVYVDPIVVAMLNTFIVHRLPPEDVEYVSRLAGGLPEGLRGRLTCLARGVALVTGQAPRLPSPVLVRVGSRRVPHRVGTTGVVEFLRKRS